MVDQLPARLSYEDATFLNFDRDQFPYNVGSVGIYEGSIPFEAYLAHVERRLNLVPRYRQRLLPVPFGVAQPAWHGDPDFNIERHISQLVLGLPGDEAQLRRAAGEFFATPLDRSKPLWEIRLVHGLSRGRTAHLAKIHHCLVDGIAGVQLLGALLDTEPDPPEAPAGEPWCPPASVPGPLLRLVDGAFDQLIEQIDAAEGMARALTNPGSAIGSVRSVATSLRAALPHLFRIGKTPWATRLTTPRRLVWQTLPFDEVQRVKEALHGTVNDVVLAVLSGALRRYLTFHGDETDGVAVRVLMPVNVRGESEKRSLGNRVSFMLAGLPVGVTDPVARFRAIQAEVAKLKEIDQAGNLDRLAGLLGRTPPAFQRFLAAQLSVPNFIYDFICTNVPGPRSPLYCLGHRMVEHYPWVPIGWRMGLGVAVMSYDGRLYLSLTADRSVLADLDRLGGFIGESFDELQDTAGAHPQVVPALSEIYTAARDDKQRVGG